MTSTSPPSTTNTPFTAPGWSIRGKVFVAPFLVVLLLLLALTLSTALQFQSIMTKLDQSRSVWPAASSELATRYAAIDAQIHADARGLTEESRRAWQTEYSAFRETTQYDRQSQHARRLEQLIARESLALPISTSDAMIPFLDSEKKRIASQTSTIGQWTIVGLRLKLPETFSGEE